MLCVKNIASLLVALALVLVVEQLTVQTNAEETEPLAPTPPEQQQQNLTKIIQLTSGQVRGVIKETKNGNTVNYYQAIRYGQAKRFSKSTPAESWSGVYEAIQPRGVCPQPGLGVSLFPGSDEDCLFLNVWQPAEPKHNRSVMVWIHGGGFFGGSIYQYDAIRFAELGDVVVVALNYRVGSLGFLTFGTEEEPGNLGLHDQILGLKWVQENIEKFGGNPRDVTIFGESAGGMSVGALVLSPLTNGLFDRAILQSGAPNIEQFFESKSKSLQKTRNFAKQMNCTELDMESIKKCLLEKTTEDLIKSAMSDFFQLKSFLPIYGDELLPISPSKMLEQTYERNLDLMFGVTRDEGSVFVHPMFPEVNMQNITLDLAKQGIQLMLDQVNVPNASLILEHYTKDLTNETSQTDLRLAVGRVLGDYILDCPTILFGQRLARTMASRDRHTYAYRVMTPVNLTIPEQFASLFPDMSGVVHGTDLVYMFDVQFFGAMVTNQNPYFDQIQSDMVKAWTEFAKTGQISPVSGVEWTEAIDKTQPEQSSLKYFAIDPTNYRMAENQWNESCDRLWKPVLFQMQTMQNKNETLTSN